MSDIRFNQWLHQSGTGGVSQSDGGHVGIGTTNPLIPVGAGNTHILNVGVVTCNNIYGSGANITGVLKNIVEDTSPQLGGDLSSNSNDILVADDDQIKLGTGADCSIYHSGADFAIINSTGNLNILNNSADAVQIRHGSEMMIKAISDGAVELYHDNVKKIETTANGLKLPDSTRIDFGDSLDLKIYHHGGNSIIDTDTGDLILRSDADDVKILAEDDILLRDNNDSTNFINCINGGAVELYHNGSKKFETDSAGTTTSGRAYITGTILQGTTVSGEANGDEATFANTGGNAGITIRSAVNAETKIYFSEGTSGGSQYRGTINYNHNTNYMAFSANEYERMRITSDGTLQLYYYNQNNGRGRINFGSSAPAFIEGYDTGNAGSGAYLKFGTNGTDRMRIDNSGHTFFSGMTNLTASGSNKGINMENSTNNGRMNIHANSSAGNALGISFYNNGANVGTIYYSTSGTSYNTSSDYRLKENEVPISDGITRLKSLKPYRFNFKVDPDKTVDGFFAHEVAHIIPEAVTGEKDAEDMQQLDYAKLTPLLTAALQEAITKIETLEAKVSALEGS